MVTVRAPFAAAALLCACGSLASAAVIDFTGGIVTQLDTSTAVTNNTLDYNNVDYYEEDGFRLDFLPNAGSAGFATHVGNYYNVGNDVIHSHWATGDFGGVMTVEITQIGGGTFDMNFFTLTSNTEFGGGFASGNEQAWVRGSVGGVPTGPDILLPFQDWGTLGGYSVVFLPAYFDAVDKVEVFATNAVDCFGMDDFFINEVPAPGTASFGALVGALALRRRRQ